VFSIGVFAQLSPHGEQLQFDCGECHTTGGWKQSIPYTTFDHSQTGFSIDGIHKQLDCKICHISLDFSEERGESVCISCHLDLHDQTLGSDCAVCHSSQSWIVNDIREIHQNSRFPLIGAHATADCFECHITENLMQFRPLGIECIDCHRHEYVATTSPNHLQAGYSTDCFDCHNVRSADWSAGGFEHGFFPLTGGHDIDDCFVCHSVGVYDKIPADCESCHIEDYNNTTDPSHLLSNFDIDCALCHSINAWRPSNFDHDALYFPIYNGKHSGEWNSCVDCHTVPTNYALFSCTDCHEHNQNDMDDEHHDENGYVYNSVNCLNCHPNGEEDK